MPFSSVMSSRFYVWLNEIEALKSRNFTRWSSCWKALKRQCSLKRFSDNWVGKSMIPANSNTWSACLTNE